MGVVQMGEPRDIEEEEFTGCRFDCGLRYWDQTFGFEFWPVT